MSIICRLTNDTLKERLNRERIEICKVPDYYVVQEQSNPNQFIIVFVNLQEHEIEEGIRRFKKVLHFNLTTE